MIRALLLPAALALLLTGCEASLARLPSQGFETHPAPLFPDDPLSTGTHVSPPATTPAQQSQTYASPVSIAPDADRRLDVNAVNAPLDALLHAMASEAGLELQSRGVAASRVTLRMQQRELPDLLDVLADQADFVWKLQGSRLEVRAGAPFAASYPVNYLNMERRTDSLVGLATQVGTINARDGGSQTIANSSQTRIENSSEQRFWASLQIDIERLVSSFTQHDGEAQSDAGFSINREAGLLNLFARPALHRRVGDYLAQLHDSTARQVLIEATVVEVALSDNFEAGVDWQMLARGVNGVSAVQSLAGVAAVDAATVDRVVAPAGLVSLVQQKGQADVNATLSLLEKFGDVRILSRPRIMALNNQSSVLKVVDNRVYFTVNVERRQTETRDEIMTETEIHTVPVGLVMNVTPQISGSGAVMLNVRPTLSRILGFVNDPNPELAEANVRNGVPEIQVREMESMLQVQSGSMAIIGGLMQETREGSDAGLPTLGRLPLLGQLFSQRRRSHRRTELLIVLRPTVIESASSLLAAASKR